MSSENAELKVKLSAEDQLSPAMKKAIGTMGEFHVGAVNLAAGLEIVKTIGEGVYKAFEFLEGQMHHAWEEALNGEKANIRLKGALLATDGDATELAKSINEYAEGLAKSVGANVEATKSMIAMGTQMGLSVGESAKMEEAARKLAAATGIGVNEAFKMLQGTLAGHSRALALNLPQVKNLSEAQLKSGEAIALVNRELDTQYKNYQGSLPMALTKASTAIDEVYKSFGNIVVQNPLTIKAINMFIDGMHELEHVAQAADKWVKDNWATISGLGVAFAKAAPLVLGLVGSIGLATSAVTMLSAAFAILTGPIGLTVIAVAAITAAFYKWPPLFDIVVGSIKLVGSTLLAMASGPLLLAITATGKLVGLYDKQFGQSMVDFAAKIKDQELSWGQAGLAQAKFGVDALKTGSTVVAVSKEEAAAVHEVNKEIQESTARVKEKTDAYAGFSIGTAKQREAAKAESEGRDKDLKNFNEYLDAKKRAAVTKAEEQQMELNKVQSSALKGAGGSAESQAGKNVEIDAESKKQAELDVLHAKGIISLEQYHAATAASDQRAAVASLAFDQAIQMERATLMGDTPEGYALRTKLQEDQFQLGMADKLRRAQEEGATQAQINGMVELDNQMHLAAMTTDKEAWIQRDMAMNQTLGNNWKVSLDQIALSQQKFGMVMGTLRGVQQTEEYKGVQTGLSNLASLRSSHSKTAFEVGKKAAIAQATVNTFLSATEAFTSLASIPIVGPALGIAAAAAAVAAGFTNIQQINSQNYGGQADEGMDSIPQSLSGKSFTLSGGERVVQPSANKELTSFLNNEKSGGGGKGGPTVVNITVNGAATKDDARKAVDMMIEELRRASERGVPIISSKGIVQNG